MTVSTKQRVSLQAALVLVGAIVWACGPTEDRSTDVASSAEALTTDPNGTCVHAVTTVGTKLTASCSVCAGNVCAKDPYCCSTSWDSVCVGEVATFCPSPSPSPVDAGALPTSVVNGGFESGLTGWTLAGTGASLGTGGHSGAASIMLAAGGQPGIRQMLQLGNATKITIDVWYRNEPNANPVYTAGIIQAAVYGVGDANCAPPVSTTWAKYSCDITKYAGKAITMTLYGNSNAVMFDDVALVSIGAVVDAGVSVDAGTLMCGPTNVPGPKQSASCGACQATVCAKDGYCCASAWDSICVNEAASWCAAGIDAGTSTPDAGTATPDAGVAKQVLNPSFENGLTSWASAGSATVNSTSGLSPAGTSHLVLQPAPGAPAEVSQVITIPANAATLGVYFRPELTAASPTTLHLMLSSPGVATSDIVLSWTNGTWASSGINVWAFAGKTTTVTIRALATAATTSFYRIDQVQTY